MVGLRCYTWAFSSCRQLGLLFVAAHGLLITVAALAAGHGLWACGLPWLRLSGSAFVAVQLQSTHTGLGLNCSEACGIFPDWGLNQGRLHCEVDSLPLSYQERPCLPLTITPCLLLLLDIYSFPLCV